MLRLNNRIDRTHIDNMIKTAVLVEDCQTTSDITAFFLRRLGIENIITIANKHEFDDFMQSEQQQPDLVVTDWNIDDKLNGGDVIDRMTKFNIPIAVLSSEDKEQIKHKVASHKECPCFSKPLDMNAFKDWLAQIGAMDYN